MSRLNNLVRSLADTVGSIYPNDRDFVDETHNLMKFLENLPDRFVFDFHLELAPEKLGTGPFEPTVTLTRNMYGWIGHFFYSSAYRVYQILDTLVKSLNDRKNIPVMMLVRSLMEYAATINYYGEQLHQEFVHLDALRENPQTNEDYLEIIKRQINIINICLKHSRLTRFNWRAYVSRDFEAFFRNWSEVPKEEKQINILTLIDKLPQEEKGARFFYEMLSDYVHPNLASHVLVIDEAYSMEENRARYVLSKKSTSEELLAFIVIHTISIPLKTSLKIIGYWIGSLKNTLETCKKWVEKGERMLGGS